jgi:hypothetical protein
MTKLVNDAVVTAILYEAQSVILLMSIFTNALKQSVALVLLRP